MTDLCVLVRKIDAVTFPIVSNWHWRKVGPRPERYHKDIYPQLITEVELRYIVQPDHATGKDGLSSWKI